MEDILDVDKNVLLETIENYGSDPTKKMSPDETILLAKTINTLCKKHNYGFDEIKFLLGTSRKTKKVPENFSDLVRMIEEREGCSKAEALKLLWGNVTGHTRQKQPPLTEVSAVGIPMVLGVIYDELQKQQSIEKAKEQTVDTDKILILGLEKAMKKGLVYKLQRDILSIRYNDPNGILDREYAEELVKKGWINIRE